VVGCVGVNESFTLSNLGQACVENAVAMGRRVHHTHVFATASLLRHSISLGSLSTVAA
jgi:hypothetical protein